MSERTLSLKGQIAVEIVAAGYGAILSQLLASRANKDELRREFFVPLVTDAFDLADELLRQEQERV